MIISPKNTIYQVIKCICCSITIDCYNFSFTLRPRYSSSSSLMKLHLLFQYERAKVIFKYALDRIPKEKAQQLYRAYTIHEKKFGNKTSIEAAINEKRKFQYEQVNTVMDH